MILTTVPQDRDTMIADGRWPESVYAVMGGVDLTIPQSVPEPAGKTFDAVFISRLHPQKGPLELMDVWKILMQKKPDARLAMIGSARSTRNAKRRRKNWHRENVEFFGFRDGVEKYKIIKSAASWCIRRCLKSAAWRRGGAGLWAARRVVRFAAAAGVLSTRLLKAPPGDFAGLADCIHRCSPTKNFTPRRARKPSRRFGMGLECAGQAMWDAIERSIAPEARPFFILPKNNYAGELSPHRHGGWNATVSFFRLLLPRCLGLRTAAACAPVAASSGRWKYAKPSGW